MASSSTVSPVAIEGVTRAPGNLSGLTFNAFCPPVMQPNTRIIGLCGITDWQGSPEDSSSDDESAQSSKSGTIRKFLGKGKEILNHPSRAKRQEREDAKMLKAYGKGFASPLNDGGFLSDFFLFHHLFRGLGAQQRWWMCERPDVLLGRYKEYAHGEPSGDHRVVLDKIMLPELEAAGTIHVSSRDDLLQDFITYFRAECKEASERNQPILLLIFGHGDPKTYGISIGGSGRPRDAPRLELSHLDRLLHPFNLAVTLLTTACHSGGWLIQPNLNISGLSAANKRVESWSWKASLGESFHGSVWATAVMDSLIKIEDSKATQFQSGSQSVEIATLDSNMKSSTFAKLSEVITNTLKSDLDANSSHKISFAAQDDEWAMEWRQRSGIPLGTFQAQWDKLPKMPSQAVTAQTPGKSGGTQGNISGPTANTTTNENVLGFRKTLTRQQASSILADLCKGYLACYPPEPRTGHDITPYREAERFLATGRTQLESMAGLQATLQYRLDAMNLATTFKDLTLPVTGQYFPPCHKFNLETWRGTLVRDSAKSRAYEGISDLLHDNWILDPPTSVQGYYFTKFNRYLAAAYAENDLDRKAVEAAIATMLAYKKEQVDAATARIRYDRTVRNTARAAFSTLGKRLRSPSPRKRGAIPRFSDQIASY